jgi:DEAD/DEAH box helicase domain-containing protein
MLPNFNTSSLYEARLQSISSGSQSNDLAKIVLAKLSNGDDFISKIQNKNFTVSYYDKFNQSELSMRLMLQFINQLKDLCSISISELNVHLEKAGFKSYSFPEFIIHNYKVYEDYVHDLNELSQNFSFKINGKAEFRLPHYRIFEFKSEDVSFTIRIDGGIAHGIKPTERLLSEKMTFNNQIFEIRKDVSHDIIYNISIDS